MITDEADRSNFYLDLSVSSSYYLTLNEVTFVL